MTLRATLNAQRPALLNALMVAAVVLPLGAQAQIDIVFNYDYDTNNFFGAAGRKSALERAARDIEARLLNETFGAITAPTLAEDSWDFFFSNPGNHLGDRVVLHNQTISANTVTVYVGGSNLFSSGPLGFADVGYRYEGSAGWKAQFASRDNRDNFDSLGGSITFNTSKSWYFGTSGAVPSASSDFYSVAAHEIFHILGFGQGQAYNADVSADKKTFVGLNVVALNGAPVPLYIDEITATSPPAHWDQEVTFGGTSPAMVPALLPGQRNAPTELDYAVLRDMGYNVTSAVPEPATWLMGLVGVAALGVRRRRSA